MTVQIGELNVGDQRYTGEDIDAYLASPEHLLKEIDVAVSRWIAGHERSQQVALGPSEIGIECGRRLGYALLGYPERPREEVAWYPTIGTQMHLGMEDVLALDDKWWSKVSAQRWLTETTVDCGMIGETPLAGHVDCFDYGTSTVIDWKFVGIKRLRAYRMKGPGAQYRVQAHTYGLGIKRTLGIEPRQVAVLFMPRDAPYEQRWMWTEPYDESVAVAAIERVNGIALTTKALGDKALDVLPAVEALCAFCPYFRSGSDDLTTGCPGAPGTNSRGMTAPKSDPRNPFGGGS